MKDIMTNDRTAPCIPPTADQPENASRPLASSLSARCFPYVLHFRFPAGTSRGVLRSKETWFLHLTRGNVEAIGECAVFRGLSHDDTPQYARRLEQLCREVSRGILPNGKDLADFPSIRFGWECAIGRLEAAEQGREFLPSEFTAGRASIPINGLVWMGDFESMAARLEEKLQQGYRCIKIKIGAIDFEDELELLARIRRRYDARDLEIRVDANGAFIPREAPLRLERLSRYHLHSIEQPIRAGQPEQMARLCADTPLAIALDEELIGVNRDEEKHRLLRMIRPQYIVLKPSLVGGMESCREWIAVADENGAGYWLTSALESNVGLDAIARFSYLCRPDLPQGLGTGSLFTDNVPYPFEIRDGRFRMKGPAPGVEEILRVFSPLDTVCAKGRPF